MALQQKQEQAIQRIASRTGQDPPNARHVLGLLFGLVLFVTCGSPGEGRSPQGTSAPSHSAAYSILWNGLPAGKAKLQCRRTDHEVLMQLQGETLAVLNTVYPIKISADSRLRADGAHPLQYKEETREGTKKKKTELLIFASDQNTVSVFKNGKLRRILQAPLGTVDPLGAVYRFLSASEDAFRASAMLVTDGKRVFEVRMTSVGREPVRTPWGKRDAEMWQASVRVLAGKPHALEQSSLHAWTLYGNPAVLVKATVRLPYGEFSIQIQESEAHVGAD
ncbi:MAG: DUF3108 domain-containing protein [Desulfosoma sp.]|uniref:DUF3108 domain-containing protein n=1 Tax=Desulfosoma sp. TaxID=2603217 RepID=UPI004049922E